MTRPEQGRLPVVRTSVEITCADEADTALAAMYGRSLMRPPAYGEAFRLAAITRSAGDLAMHTIEFGAEADCTADGYPLGMFVFTRAGRAQVRSARTEYVLAPGMSCASPNRTARYILQGVKGVKGDLLALPGGALERAASEQGHDGVRLLGGLPGSSRAAMAWQRTGSYVRSLLDDPSYPLAEPLFNLSTVNLIAATALAAFPNTTHTAAYLPGPGRAGPSALRRATDYIDEHAHEAITLTDLADVSRTNAPMLAEEFHRHRDCTPEDYQRRARLDRAHAEIAEDSQEGGRDIAGLARRWGWGSTHAFAADYRSVYGTSPRGH
ncbi:AraC family transcriptional regulator [Streptomyces sp. NPDC047023]|uniref:helix-turn-helix transcriptional regulator n=1 Tax=Streptomyces sp. NPDC047023 TaxID=3155139 RepID=UPI0033EF7EB3